MTVEGRRRMISLRRIEAVYAGLDWLTLTLPLDASQVPYLYSLWQRSIKSIADEGNELKPRSLQGYDGMSSGNCFVGERHDSVMLQLTGAHANEHYASVWRSDCRIPRLDVQTTVKFRKEVKDVAKRGYDALTRHSHSDPKAKNRKYSIIRGSDGGDTLYIGSRTSEQFGRLYNKAVQSEQTVYDRCWRWEIVFKNDMASNLGPRIPKSIDERAKWAATLVKNWYRRRGINMDFGAGDEPVALPLFQARKTDVQTKLDWLESQVRPTVTFLTEHGYGDSVYTALGLPSLSETLLDDPGSVKKGE